VDGRVITNGLEGFLRVFLVVFVVMTGLNIFNQCPNGRGSDGE
jgi:hypothetical protein